MLRTQKSGTLFGSLVPTRVAETEAHQPVLAKFQRILYSNLNGKQSVLEKRLNNTNVLNKDLLVRFNVAFIADISKLLATGESDPLEVTRANLDGLNLESVEPEELAEFKNLQVLDIGDNNLQLEDVVELPALKELRLPCNGITSIAGRWLVTHLQHLEKLDLSFNKIPKSCIKLLGTLPSLSYLDLSYNEISELPDSMASFEKLMTLNLENNKLKSEKILPLTTIPNLRELNLSRNELLKFPDIKALQPEGFSRLEVLDLSGNKFSTQEDVKHLWALENLSQVFLWATPISSRVLTNNAKIEIHTVEPTPTRLPIKIDFSVLPLPPSPTAKRKSITNKLPKLEPVPQQPSSSTVVLKENTNSFFLTEVGFELEETSTTTTRKAPNSHASCYDPLFERDEDEEDEDDLIKGDIRGAVNALRLALSHPMGFTYYSSSSRLQSRQQTRQRNQSAQRDATKLFTYSNYTDEQLTQDSSEVPLEKNQQDLMTAFLTRQHSSFLSSTRTIPISRESSIQSVDSKSQKATLLAKVRSRSKVYVNE